jgi:hypothetical protein
LFGLFCCKYSHSGGISEGYDNHRGQDHSLNNLLLVRKVEKEVYICIKLRLQAREKLTKLFIQNMVCIRCKMVVSSELDKLGISHGPIDLS